MTYSPSWLLSHRLVDLRQRLEHFREISQVLRIKTTDAGSKAVDLSKFIVLTTGCIDSVIGGPRVLAR